jgi:dUTP pyrophosphatase
MKIKVFLSGKQKLPNVIKKGDWIDLCSNEFYNAIGPQTKVQSRNSGRRDTVVNYHLLDLGVAMQLPKGYEAIVVPRSSSYRHFGFIQANSIGVIDNTYCSEKDIWKLPILSLSDTTIYEGDRVAQFRIQLSQKASMWQKIKWLFSSKIKLVKVDHLRNEERGGIGSTGIA